MYKTIHIVIIALLSTSIFKAQDSLWITTPDLQVNENKGSGEQRNVSALIFQNNEYAFYWFDKRNTGTVVNSSYDIFFQKYDEFNNKINTNQLLFTNKNNCVIKSNGKGVNVACFFENGSLFLQRLDDNFIPLTDFVQIDMQNFTEVQDNSFDLAINENGEFLVAWLGIKGFITFYAVYGQTFSSDLEPLNEPFPILFIPFDGEYSKPVVSVNSDNDFVIASFGAKRYDITHNIFLQIYSDSGLLPNAIRVNDYENNYYAWSNASIGVADGMINVAFQGIHKVNSSYPHELILMQQISNSGEKINGNLIISDTLRYVSNDKPGISTNESGVSLITWKYQDTPETNICAMLIDKNGNPMEDSEIILNGGDIPADVQYYLTSSVYNYRDNGFIVTREDRTGFDFNVYYAIIDSTGGIMHPFTIISDDKGSDQLRPALTIKNNFSAFAWEDFRNGFSDIYSRIIQPNGNITSEYLVSHAENLASNPAIDALSDNNILICWTELLGYTFSSGLYAKIIDLNGNAIMETKRLNTPGLSELPESPKISSNKLGDIIIVYNIANRIYYQWLNSDYQLVGNNVLASDNGYGNTAPDCVLNSKSEFFICWEDNNKITPSKKPDIRLRNFFPDGTPMGKSFVINDDNVDSVTNKDPRIAINPNTDNFIVVWTDNRNGDFDIFAQRFDKNGSPVGNNLIVSRDNSGADQFRPVVAMDSLDNFVIAWEDKRNGDSDIYAQIFLPDGSPWGDNFLVNQDKLRTQWFPEVEVNGNKIYFTWSSNHAGGTGFDIWTNTFQWDLKTGIQEKEVDNFSLNIDSYPNPFNSSTRIIYSLPEQTEVKIKLFDVIGREIDILVNETKPRGNYEIIFQPDNLASGIYFITMQTKQNLMLSEKLIYLK